MASSDDAIGSDQTSPGISRREAIKKGAVVGGAVLWATPVVQSIGISPASATHVSPGPHPCPTCAACDAEATGLKALGLSAGHTSSGCTCVLNANLNLATLAGASAQVVCGKADDAACTASSYVAGLKVRIGTNATLEAGVLGSCVSCGTGTSYVLNLELVTVNPINQKVTRTPLTVDPGCNKSVAVPNFALVAVVANEQFCTNGTLTVRALRVTVAGLDVIAAQSKAGGSGCACSACSPNPACTAPTSQLC